MNNDKLKQLSEEYFLITHPDGTWEIIHGDHIRKIKGPSQ